MALLERTSSHYSISGAFSSGTGDSIPSRVVAFEPGQSEREQLILDKMGTNGWGRWQYFRKVFSGGWGNNGQKPLSPRSQDMFFLALERIVFPEGVIPSLFLTDDGFLELAWRDKNGKAIQIEFGSTESEIYVEETETEITFPNSSLIQVITETLG